MKKMTEENLKNAFGGESQAHIKYMVFSEKAEAENLTNIARVFKANSFAEQVHATNHLKVLGGIGKTVENLQAAIEGETFEITEMYPAYALVAEDQGEKGAQTMIKWALAAEEVHRGLYQKAKEALEKGKDLESKPINVCTVCGYTVEGEAPDICPMCRSPKEKFRAF